MSRTCGWCHRRRGAAPLTSGTVRDMDRGVARTGRGSRSRAARRRMDRKSVVVLDLRGGEPFAPAIGELSALESRGRRTAAGSPSGRGPDPQRLHRGAGPEAPRPTRRAAGATGDGPRLPLGRDRIHRPAPAALRRGRGRGGAAARADDARLRAWTRWRGGRTEGRSPSSPIRARTPTSIRARRSGRWSSPRGGRPRDRQCRRPPVPREILALAGPVYAPGVLARTAAGSPPSAWTTPTTSTTCPRPCSWGRRTGGPALPPSPRTSTGRSETGPTPT